MIWFDLIWFDSTIRKQYGATFSVCKLFKLLFKKVTSKENVTYTELIYHTNIGMLE
jgi:hypothetical protein